MKTCLKFYYLIFLFALSLTSCQDESVEIINPTEQNTLVPNSELSNLMLRASANNVSADNVLDNSSCFSVELPVTITVSDTTIIINSQDDLDELEDLLEDFGNALPQFIFPITIVSNDYSETVIENQNQLDALLEQCFDDDDAIECVDFVYPISFSVFNTQFVLIDTVIIESSNALYAFLDDLDDQDNNLLVGINFPVSVVLSNGDIVAVNSNAELASAIQNGESICGNDTYIPCNIDDIKAKLKECSWEIDDELNDFDDLEVTFNDDFSLIITGENNQTSISGNWTVEENANGTFIVLSNLSDLQDDLQGNWLIIECEDDELEIKKNGLELELERNCEDDINCSTSEIFEELKECKWFGTSNLISDVTETLFFKENGDIKLSESLTVIGNFSFSVIGGNTFIDLMFSSEYQQLSGQWKVTDCDDDDDKFEFVKGNDTLILEQDCGADNDDSFDCFDSFDAIIELCDTSSDGFETFNLTIAYANCAPSADLVSYHITLADAESNSNPIANPEAYTNTTAPQIIYVRVEIGNEIEIFELKLKLSDCTNNNCSEADVVNILKECEWTISSYAGDESFNIFEIDFMVGNALTIESDSESYTGNWTASQDGDYVYVEFTNISGGNVQLFNGMNFKVVECTPTRIILHDVMDSNNELVLDKDCD